jgi:hypothetical protein
MPGVHNHIFCDADGMFYESSSLGLRLVGHSQYGQSGAWLWAWPGVKVCSPVKELGNKIETPSWLRMVRFEDTISKYGCTRPYQVPGYTVYYISKFRTKFTAQDSEFTEWRSFRSRLKNCTFVYLCTIWYSRCIQKVFSTVLLDYFSC